MREIIYLVLIIIITVFFYRGSKIAEWFTMMWCVHPGAAILFWILRHLGISGEFGGWSMIVAVIFLVVLLIIILSNIQAFLEYQRNKR